MGWSRMAEKGGPKVSNGMVKSCRKGWPESIEWDGLKWQKMVARRYRKGWSRVAEKGGPKVSNGMV